MTAIEGFSPRFATSIVFTDAGGAEVFRIGPDGKLTAGPGLSPDQVSQVLFEALVRNFPELMAGLARPEA